MLYETPADNATLAELGKTIGASTRTLSRLFRNELGMTFYEWRTQLRIYHALVLLAEGHDTTRTAYACGWANPSSFIAAFTNIIGTTPGRYRTSRRHRVEGSSGAATQPAWVAGVVMSAATECSALIRWLAGGLLARSSRGR